MITGFNTDVEHDGVVYHVQTEDKGLNSPLILSLVYSGGAILASKRTPYKDLIASGFDEAVLSERLKRQHKLICAAIRAGRVEELKQMAARDFRKSETPAVAQAAPVEPFAPPKLQTSSDGEDLPEVEQLEIITGNAQDEPTTLFVQESEPPPMVPPQPEPPELLIIGNAQEEPTTVPVESEQVTAEPQSPGPDIVGIAEEQPTSLSQNPEPPTVVKPSTPPRSRRAEPQVPTQPYVVFDSRRESEAQFRQGLNVSLLSEYEFRSGDTVKIGILVTHRSGRRQKPLAGVSVSVKILGTTFRPIILTKKTENDGVVVVKADIPRFSTGRAAILIRAVEGADSVEIRRVVKPEGKK